MYVWTFIIVCLILHFVVSRTKIVQNTKNAPQINRNTLQQVIKESGAKGIEYVSYNFKSAAILDEVNSKLYIYNYTDRDRYNHFSYSYSVVDLDDIIESEVIVDDNTITKVGRGSQVIGAAIGGAVLGGVGAIIGGLSGNKTSSKEIKNIDIKLTVNDLNNPVYKINFLNSETESYNTYKTGHRKDSFLCERALEQVDKWQGMFEVILHEQKQK